MVVAKADGLAIVEPFRDGIVALGVTRTGDTLDCASIEGSEMRRRESCEVRILKGGRTDRWQSSVP